jgi:hypothetical protein
VRARAAVAIGTAVGVLAVSAAASEGSSPGDALYGVKGSAERAQLAIAGLLTGYAVANRDPRPLTTVYTFAIEQRTDLRLVASTARTANRQRADDSLELLYDVSRRSDLREALTCSVIVQDGSDALGPVPGPCGGNGR